MDVFVILVNLIEKKVWLVGSSFSFYFLTPAKVQYKVALGFFD